MQAELALLTSRLASTALCAGRDVTTSMANEGVEDTRDFKWESQLRYYWEHHEAPPSGVKPQVRPCCLALALASQHSQSVPAMWSLIL